MLPTGVVQVGTPNKVIIIVPGAENSRFGEFFDYFNNMEKPSGTAVTFVRGQSPARNRNIAIDMGLKLGCTHMLFIDDDMAFRPDMLSKLMSHNVDVCTGLYLKRNFPHEPLIFNMVDEKGYCGYKFLDDNLTGLTPIVAAGFGAILIKSWVFRKMQESEPREIPEGLAYPWIRLGELEVDHWCDDIGFFNRLRRHCPEAKMYADLDVKVGHMANVTIWPNYINGKWFTTYNSNGRGEVNIPTCTPATPEQIKEIQKKELVSAGIN